MVSFWGDENVQKLRVTVSQPYEYTKNLWLVHFKWVNLFKYVCMYDLWLYLNKAVFKCMCCYVVVYKAPTKKVDLSLTLIFTSV